jgi:DHA1 family multidrug resistance protein-like MFS transporter
MPMPAWRRNQIAVTVAACLVFAGFTLVLPFLPYYVEQMGVRGKAVDIWAGLLLSVAPFIAALMAPMWGRLADRYGMKIMVQRTILTMIVHWVLMGFATKLWHLLALRIFLGLFSGFAAMSVALVTYGAPKEKIGSIVGTLQSAQILAAAVGPFLGGVLYEAVGIRATCFVTALLCLSGFALVTYAYDDREIRASLGRSPQRPDSGSPADRAPGQPAPPASSIAGASIPQGGEYRSPTHAGEEPHGPPLPLLGILRLPGFMTIAVVLLLATVISRSFGLVAPLYVRHLASGSSRVGLLAGITVSIGSLAEALSAIIQGRLASRLMPRFLLFAGLSLASVAVLPMMLVDSAVPFMLLRALQGFVAGGTLTLGYTMGGAIFPQNSRATAFGLLSSAAMLGGACGPMLAGFISAGVGIRWVFAAASILYSILALVTLRGLRREVGMQAHPPSPTERPYIPVPR